MPNPELRIVTSGPLPYLVSLPAGDADGPRPVLCFLHGYDEGAPAPLREGLTRHGPLRVRSAPRATAELIVVAPQLPRMGDHWHLHADAVRAIVEEVRAAHGGDAARTYLTGFSFGGNGVFDLALAQPGSWAALWAVDPTRVPRGDPGRPVWLSIGAAARPRTPAFVRSLGLQPAGPAPAADRIWLDEGEDHVGSATRAYRDERIYDWLLARRL
jgi:poly(3-hydroxybutyrate) depolymerase